MLGSSLSPGSYVLSDLSSVMASKSRGAACDADVIFVAEDSTASTVTQSLPFDQVWVYESTAANCRTKKLL